MKVIRRFLRMIRQHIIPILIVLIAITSIILYFIQKEDTTFFQSKARYHFYFVGQNLVDPFWKEIRLGAENAAKDYNVAVEFNAPRFNNSKEELKYLDIAILSNVDGIITHVSNDSNFTELIDKAYSKGIPVITIENDDKSSNKNTFVGTNSFLLGTEAAKLMIKATDKEANIAIIISNDYEPDTASQNLKISGFLSAIKDQTNMEVVKTFTSKMGILSSEEITQSIINNYPEIDAIFTTNSVDTLGAAQLIVDHNRVGNITLVGYGDTKNILEYIKKGIIYGTVMSDPYKMGYESIKAMMDIKEDNNVSAFIDTGVKIIEKSNLEEYIMKLK